MGEEWEWICRELKVIRSVSPDLIALQEIDRNCTRSGSVDLTAELGANQWIWEIYGFSGG